MNLIHLKNLNASILFRVIFLIGLLVTILLPSFSRDFHIVTYENPFEYLTGIKKIMFFGLLILIGSPLLISFYFFTKRVGFLGSIFTFVLVWLSSLFATLWLMKAIHSSKLKLIDYSILNTGWDSRATMELSFDICMLQIFWHSLIQAVIVATLFIVFKKLNKTFKVNTTKAVATAMCLFAVGFVSSEKTYANQLTDAKMYEKQGKYDKAALSATSGCISQDVKSCAFLCALGLKVQNAEYEKAGCSMACTLGDGTACASYGSALIKQGDDAEGVRTLKRGCTLGSKIACSQLKLLKQ